LRVILLALEAEDLWAFQVKESWIQVPVQDFVVRNDTLCGSTIGPLVSARTGIRTVDIGIPQLSMHSIREMCGTVDVTHTLKLLKTFFAQFEKLDESLIVD